MGCVNGINVIPPTKKKKKKKNWKKDFYLQLPSQNNCNYKSAFKIIISQK
jgi:hypothetical protein